MGSHTTQGKAVESVMVDKETSSLLDTAQKHRKTSTLEEFMELALRFHEPDRKNLFTLEKRAKELAQAFDDGKGTLPDFVVEYCKHVLNFRKMGVTHTDVPNITARLQPEKVVDINHSRNRDRHGGRKKEES